MVVCEYAYHSEYHHCGCNILFIMLHVVKATQDDKLFHFILRYYGIWSSNEMVNKQLVVC